MIDLLPRVSPHLELATQVLSLWLIAMFLLTCAALFHAIRMMLEEREALHEHEMREAPAPTLRMSWVPTDERAEMDGSTPALSSEELR